MAVKDINVDKNAKHARELVRLVLGVSATGQAAKLVDSVTPGFAFEIVKVEVMAVTVTANISADVQIGGTTALNAAVVPVAATPTAAVLAATLAARRGSASEAIQLKYTSDGTGAATNLVVSVWIRPLPLDGEVYSV
jgi:hypothetical protein